MKTEASYNFVFRCFAIMCFVTACTSEKSFKQRVGRALQEDPSILTRAMEENPEVFYLAVQTSVAYANTQRQKQIEEYRKKEIDHYLKRPLNPRYLSNDVYRGNPDAPITIVQYIDFDCGYCRRGQVVMDRLEQTYQNQIRFLIRHLPSSDKEHSLLAAKFFEALKRQDGNLAYRWYDQVMSKQGSMALEASLFKHEAKVLGANMNRLYLDVERADILQKIVDDSAEARRFGFRGTPGYVVGGVPINGAYPQETFVRLIEELSRQERLGVR